MFKSAIGTLLILATAHVADAATCDNLASLKLPDTTVTLAQAVEAAAFMPPAGPGARGNGPQGNAYGKLPAFCRVAATLKPSTDSDIKIEVWLPISGWTGKFE